MPAGSAAAVAKRKAQRRREQAAAKEERAKALAAQIETWFAKHDTDANGSLDQAQFKSLLESVFPGSQLNESTVKMLVEKCGGAVTKENVIAAVNKFGAVSGSPARALVFPDPPGLPPSR